SACLLRVIVSPITIVCKFFILASLRKLTKSESSDTRTRVSRPLFHYKHAFLCERRGNYVAIYPISFFSVELYKRCTIHDLQSCFSKWFSLLQDHELRKVIFVFDKQIKPIPQEFASVTCRSHTPRWKSVRCCSDRPLGILSTHERYRRKNLPCGWVINLQEVLPDNPPTSHIVPVGNLLFSIA
ncbi:hypothetical protein M758_UG118500, partial [Ceratodon purpureus]